jgi:putative flavoprotein involved in K+ transport
LTDRTDVLVVGAGQAGLAAGYYLARAGIPFLIIDGVARIGDSWRSRWDSLALFTVARYSGLPGLPFPGDPEHFPGKDEVGDYLEEYARGFDMPIRLNARATMLERRDGGYRAETEDCTYEARQVIVATGAYQRPHVPEIAQKLSDSVAQVHSAEYTNPEQVGRGEVLVVGAANSGAQIAEDLAPSRRVYLAQGRRIPRMPRRLLGRSLYWWADHLRLLTAPLEGSLRGRTQRGDLLIGTSLRQRERRHGVTLLERAVDADGHTVTFDDGRTVEVESVVWATGYRPDYPWLKMPVLDASGAPIQRRGVTESEGLYFLGMRDLYSRGSSLIGWVKHDAEHIVDHIRRAAPAAASVSQSA